MSRFSPGITKRAAQPPSGPMKRVLFVCIGNLCRSPMAEALARKYGSDVLIARSAGVSPSFVSAPITRMVLLERNVDLGDHIPKYLEEVDFTQCDLVVNMSGRKLPAYVSAPVEDWPVPDPFGGPEPVYRQACDDIESRVMRLILRIRNGKI